MRLPVFALVTDMTGFVGSWVGRRVKGEASGGNICEGVWQRGSCRGIREGLTDWKGGTKAWVPHRGGEAGMLLLVKGGVVGVAASANRRRWDVALGVMAGVTICSGVRLQKSCCPLQKR